MMVMVTSDDKVGGWHKDAGHGMVQQLCSRERCCSRMDDGSWTGRMALDDALFGGKYSLKQIVEVKYS